MPIPKSELEQFRNTLRRVDWSYAYAEGKSYYDGRDSVRRAGDVYVRLIAAYPDSADEITRTFKSHGRD